MLPIFDDAASVKDLFINLLENVTGIETFHAFINGDIIDFDNEAGLICVLLLHLQFNSANDALRLYVNHCRPKNFCERFLTQNTHQRDT